VVLGVLTLNLEPLNSDATVQEITSKESLSIVLPIYNEEAVLETNVLRLRSFLDSAFKCEWQIVIADNLSTDQTARIGRMLANSYSGVKYIRINRKGVGIALKTAWDNSDASIHVHIDGDLPFDFADMKRLIETAQKGYDVCFGSRFTNGSFSDAKPLRQFLSKIFHYWIRLLFSYEYTDICGIKAVRREAFLALSPHLTSDGWFFNTELMLLANKAKMSIKEVPVHVREPPGRKSKVNLFQTVTNLFLLTFKLKLKFWIDGPTPKSTKTKLNTVKPAASRAR
jgi:glycosyltransferase involved in cell wall biosynthesis